MKANSARSMFRMLVCLIWLSCTSLFAQTPAQQFSAADWFHRPLAPGVDWYHYQFDDLFNSPQSISYVEADLDVPGVHIELPHLNGRKKTTELITDQFPNAAAGINGTFFRTGGHATFLRVKGVEIPPVDTWSNWGYNGGFVFNRATKRADVIRRPNAQTGNPITDWRSNAATWPDAMVNGPLLMANGNITRNLFPSGSHCNRNPRTMVGIKPGNIVVLVVVDGRHSGNAAGLTCEEMAQVMFALGCTDALSLDGGGSSVLYGRGEPFNGILSYPSDNGGYDHDPKDERSVSNGIAIRGNAPVPLPFDARLEYVSSIGAIAGGQQRYVTVRYRNIGSQPWQGGRVSLTTSRPSGRDSRLHDSLNWIDSSTPWRHSVGSVVQPGGTLQFSFVIKGPTVSAPEIIEETFQLTLDGTQRFGPADNALKLEATVSPPAGSFIVESRSGGHNYAWYSDLGMADTGVDCLAPGATEGIGMRYGSTYRSVAGAKSANWLPIFPARGFYRVYVAWGDAGLRRSPITYHIKHRAGTTTINLNQTSTADEWIQLAGREFEFEAGANGQGVTMTNENVDVSGNMYAGPVSFVYIGPSEITDWSLY